MFFQHRRKLNIIIFSLALLLHLCHDISLQVDYAVGLNLKKKKKKCSKSFLNVKYHVQ